MGSFPFPRFFHLSTEAQDARVSPGGGGSSQEQKRGGNGLIAQKRRRRPVLP
jgi:hypothetical protein